ncbi:hypothetical protein FRZ44_33560 [Hypericibacter terrae]|uniref:LamG domain-containing protein n=2 Tax=Hypericibacter terrae TaxID=2602015 RepID=A0A5J6MKD8_9PROT|nr:hypothetical protein FRZ44_33560 [Hypericibacter terrae]
MEPHKPATVLSARAERWADVMGILVNPFMFARPWVFSAAGSHFDGAAALSRTGIDGVADSAKFTLSAWINLTGGDGLRQVPFRIEGSGGQRLTFERTTGNKYNISARHGTTTVADVTSTASFVAGSGWKHILASCDVSGATGVFQLYIQDAAAGTSTVSGSQIIDWTSNGLVRLSSATSASPAFQVQGDMAEFFLDIKNALDLTVTANRRKFISASGHPVDLGSQGALPFGMQPAYYFHRGVSESPTTFIDNRGYGGAFALSGSLSASATDP